MANKLYYVLGVDTQDFVVQDNGEAELWEQIEALQLQKYLIEKEKPKNKYKKVNGEKTLINGDVVSEWVSAHKEELRDINKKLNVLKDDFRKAIELNKNVKRELLPHKIAKRSGVGVSDGKKVTIADSTLTRTLKLNKASLNTEICIIRVYYTGIMESLIKNGFTYNGSDYVFFTASAGQTKSKKFVAIKKSAKDKHWNKLAAGLTLDEINANGGCNTAKFLAYVSLCSSMSKLWNGFDIDRSIVVDDFQNEVTGEVDYIDFDTYEITHGIKTLPMEQNDGSGMVLPSVSKKDFVVRMAWFKGLMGVFDFRKFIEVNNCSPIIKDIYGDEHNIIEEDIQVIFTKSQFKMWKYFKNWNDYKERFKKYNCEACIGNEEDAEFAGQRKLNYQFVQTLRSLTNEEIATLSQASVEEILKLGTSVNNKSVDKDYILSIFGATADNKNKSPFQKCLYEYPEMLQDKYIKDQLRAKKESLVKELYSAKFLVDGNYTFALPDFYAFCEHLFMGIKNPDGLLKAGEVSCRLFENGIELDCLRSPHLYCEHCIERNNIQEWFTTNAVYTNSHDFLSRIVALDWDGDHMFICSDKIIINAAKKVIEKLNICPLYYEAKKAPNQLINDDTMFKCMETAFNSKSIGYYSNAITKIWNTARNDDWNLTEEQIRVIKLLCGENNYQIDFFKTMYMPTRPSHINYIISKHLSAKVPRFFEYAKDYAYEQTDTLTNTPVNNIPEVVKLPRIRYGQFDFNTKFDYREFLSKPMTDERFNQAIVNIYKDVVNSSKFDKKNDEVVKDYKFVINSARNKIYSRCKEIGITNWHEIVDNIVEEIFGRNPTGKKQMFWEMFGSTMYQHLMKDFDTDIDISYCVDCGEEIVLHTKSNTCRCRQCQKDYTEATHRKDMREKYVPIDNRFTKICIACGRGFDVGSKSKRELCDFCYRKDLGRRKAESVRKVRSKEKFSISNLDF